MAWHEQTGALDTFAHYCAPTALAELMECSNREAADLLLSIPGMANPRRGFVNTAKWKDLLEDLGGDVRHPVRPDAEERLDQGMRWTSARYYTVTQYLRKHPTGTLVFSVQGHTLLARDGEVVADTRRTKSSRSRVQWAAHFENLDRS